MTEKTARALLGVEIPLSVTLERCRSCGAPIWWGKTASGKSNPFDVVLGKPTTVTHFSTCPDAKQWSKR